MMPWYAAIVLWILAFATGYQIAMARKEWEWRKNSLPMPNGLRVEIDPLDPYDPMRDQNVRVMLAEVLETGRPMSMNRGEAPVFVDEQDEKDKTNG